MQNSAKVQQLMTGIKEGSASVIRAVVASMNAKELPVAFTAVVHALVRHKNSLFAVQILKVFESAAQKNGIVLQVDTVDKYNVTPWFYACIKPTASVARQLLKMGANAAQEDESGKNAWHFAISSGSVAVFEWLKALCIPVDKVDRLGYGCVEYAIVFRQPLMLGWLMQQALIIQSVQKQIKDRAAFKEVEDYFGSIYHVLAANPEFKPWQKCAQWLYDLGAAINLKDARGNTPLHVCVIHNHVKLAHWLLEQGADMFVLNNFHQYPEQMMAQDAALRSWYQQSLGSAAQLITSYQQRQYLESQLDQTSKPDKQSSGYLGLML